MKLFAFLAGYYGPSNSFLLERKGFGPSSTNEPRKVTEILDETKEIRRAIANLQEDLRKIKIDRSRQLIFVNDLPNVIDINKVPIGKIRM